MTHHAETTRTDLAVRPFRINVPEAALVDLRRRIAATRWPDKETVADQSQGMQLATIHELAPCAVRSQHCSLVNSTTIDELVNDLKGESWTKPIRSCERRSS
jgi:Epoxide hydrolase N terminus